MPNPLFNILGNSVKQSNPYENMTDFFKQLNEYKKGLNGDPNQILQNMIQSGRIPQDRLNDAINAARQIRQFIR